MPGSIYVSHPKVWDQAFKDIRSGKLKPEKSTRQWGRGMASQYRTPSMIRIPMISPVTAVEERARVQLKSEKKEGLPYIKVSRIRKSDSQSKTVKKRTSSPKKTPKSKKSIVKRPRKKATKDRFKNTAFA